MAKYIPGIVAIPFEFVANVSRAVGFDFLRFWEIALIPPAFRPYRMYSHYGERGALSYRSYNVSRWGFWVYLAMDALESPFGWEKDIDIEKFRVCVDCDKFTDTRIGNGYTQCGCNR